MQWLDVLWFCLTVLFFVGLVGSCFVVVLFLVELVRTVLRSDQNTEDEPVAGS